MVKGRADYWASGDWNAACSMCGRKRKASQLVKNWKGQYRCPEHNEPREAQDFVRSVPDDMSVPWAQDETDTNVGPTSTLPFLNGMTAIPYWAMPGASIPSRVVPNTGNVYFLPTVPMYNPPWPAIPQCVAPVLTFTGTAPFITVTLTDLTPGVTIYYTTGGTTPTFGSPIYTGPFIVGSAAVVQAFSYLPGYLVSSVVAQSFSGDPFFSNVGLLLPLDNVGLPQGVSDFSSFAHPMTWSAGGGSSISLSNPRFGTGSANYTSTTGSGPSTPMTPSLDLHQSIFTVELWVNTTASGTRTLWSDSNFVVSDWHKAYISVGTVQYQPNFTSGSGGIASYSATSVNDGNWHHIVVGVNGTVSAIAVDGVWGAAAGWLPSTSPAGATNFYIGYDGSAFSGTSMVGQIDEVRVTKGVLRYTIGTNFTPPTAAFLTY